MLLALRTDTEKKTIHLHSDTPFDASQHKPGLAVLLLDESNQDSSMSV